MDLQNDLKLNVTALRSVGDDISVEITVQSGENVCKECFVISCSAYVELGIKKGECSTELYESVAAESKTYAAFRRGAYILGFGICSEKMLVSKLLQKGFEREAAINAVARLSEKGFLNNRQNAHREAEKCAAKLWGQTRIKAELLKKGYSSEDAESAIFSLEDAGLDFDESCETLIDKKYPALPKERVEMQKLIASVCRYGYSIGQIKAAAARISEKRRKDIFYGHKNL